MRVFQPVPRPPASDGILERPSLWIVVGAVVTLIRLVWVSYQGVFAADLGWDDRLYLDAAVHLLRGEWLGPYGPRTLVKEPFYALWVAATSAVGLPLLLAQHLLYSAASALMTWALAPLLKRPALSLLLYVVLLANPISYTDGVMTSVYRDGLYPAATLIVAACATGLCVRCSGPAGRIAAWSAGLGTALPVASLTRDEGILIAPLFLLVVGAGVTILRSPSPGRSARVAALGLPLLLWPAGIATVALVNLAQYGVFRVVDIHRGALPAAFGALARAGAADFVPLVPVPRKVLRRLYAISPSCAELEPHLEGHVGRMWAFTSWGELGEQRDGVAGGWFLFALREAVALNGHYRSALAAEEYYQRLADEVNAACDDGRIPCTAPHATLRPVWHHHYMRLLGPTFLRAAWYLVRFDGFEAEPTASRGSPASLDLYRAVTHEPLALSAPVQVRGRVGSRDGEIRVVVRRPSGVEAQSDVRFSARADPSNGGSLPPFDFVVYTDCPAWCSLEFWAGERLGARMPLDGRPRSIELADFALQLDAVPERLTLPASGVFFDRLRLQTLLVLAQVYRWFTPTFSLLAVALYCVVTARAFTRRRVDTAWVVSTALLGTVILRLLALSLIKIASFDTFWSSYMAPAHPLLLAFVVVVTVAAWRARPARLCPGGVHAT